MSWQTLLLFAPACFALNMAFGPNNLLSLTNGARQGAWMATLAAQGRIVAFAAMIVVTALGLGALLAASELAFTVVKWVGAAYLVWLGVKILRGAAAVPTRTEDGKRTLRSLAGQEFWVAAGNPKAILIFTAFFPQFLDQNAYWMSFLVMGVVFLALEVVAIALYAMLGARLGAATRSGRLLPWFNRVSGTMMIGFGVALALTRRPA